MFRRGLLREYTGVLSLVARTIDVLCVFFGALIVYYGRFGTWEMPSTYQVAVLLAILFSIIIFPASGIYHSWRGKSWLHQAQVVTLSWASVVTVLIIILFLTKTSAEFSRQWMGFWIIVSWGLLLLFRYLLMHVLRAMRAKGYNHKRIVIIGAGFLGKSVAHNIKEADWTGLEIVAFLDDDEKLHDQWIEGIQVIGSAGNANLFIQQQQIDEVWIALPLKAEARVREILYDLRHSTVNIRYVPNIFGFRLLNHSVTDIAGIAVMDLSTSPMVGLNRFIKGVEDRVLALFILLTVSPLLLIIALGIKLTSPGPVLFKQKRHGWDGKTIKVYKFRSMVVHREDGGTVTQAQKSDYRVTPFGAFLRHTSLDELPQFFNVLRGDMSIVGPRPHAIVHNEKYKDQINAYMLRHKVKPGITGWAQVNGFRGETNTLDKMRQRVEYDLYYIENWSLWFDIKIIFQTLLKGFVNKNAY